MWFWLSVSVQVGTLTAKMLVFVTSPTLAIISIPNFLHIDDVTSTSYKIKLEGSLGEKKT